MIKYLQRSEVDDKKWNDCIRDAVNSFPYGYTWYLDTIAEHWDALVDEDYQMVFPMVWRRKLSFYYLYQPLFAQQLGIFSLQNPDAVVIKKFVDEIPEKFKYVDISMNYLNHLEHPDFEITPRTNFQLDLNSTYEEISKQYSENTRRNVKKAGSGNLSITKSINPNDLVEFLKSNIGDTLPEVKSHDYDVINRIIQKSLEDKRGETYGVYLNNHLVASGFFLFGKNRVINLFPSNSEEGKKAGAGFLLMDYIIKSNCGKPGILDFEGSMIESIARFYKGFGAEEVNYWRLKRNDLPWYLKIFKK